VRGVIAAFANDDRILGWDLWNEPGADNAGSYLKHELKDKQSRVKVLLPQVFQSAREANPSQPLTSGLWDTDRATKGASLGELQEIQLRESDIITFHNYSWPENFKAEINWLKKNNRPVICTEYIARSVGSTFDTVLPIANEERVGAINWDSSLEKRRLTTRGNRGSIRMCMSSRRCGSTTCSIPTANRTVRRRRI